MAWPCLYRHASARWHSDIDDALIQLIRRYAPAMQVDATPLGAEQRLMSCCSMPPAALYCSTAARRLSFFCQLRFDVGRSGFISDDAVQCPRCHFSGNIG